MTPAQVKKYYKSQYNFHKQTGMAAATLGNWLAWGYVPKNSQYRLEHLTKGVLKTQWSEKNTNEKQDL